MKAMVDIFMVSLESWIVFFAPSLDVRRRTGSWQHERQGPRKRCVGLNYLKYDLCTYHDVVPAGKLHAPAHSLIVDGRTFEKTAARYCF